MFFCEGCIFVVGKFFLECFRAGRILYPNDSYPLVWILGVAGGGL